MLEIFEVNENNKDEVMNYLNETARVIIDNREKEVLEGLENDLQKVIFLDWWNGGSLWSSGDRAKRYKHVNKHDWDTVHDWILETVSMGMG